MPTKRGIPQHIQHALCERLEQHARTKYANQCERVTVRLRGAFAYIDAVVSQFNGEAEPVRMCRLGYTGDPDRWSFAFYKYSDEKYELSVGMTGSFLVTPEEAFDCAAFAYLPG